MNKNVQFTIQRVDTFQVVRDDLFEGGTKRRAFERLISVFSENEFVYACDYYGHAAYAIALTALDVGKHVSLFYVSPPVETNIFKKTIALDNVSYTIVEDAHTQIEASHAAKSYAARNHAHFLPIGLDFPAFGVALEQVVKEAHIDASEIWCMGGSGTLGRALQRAYPNTPVHVVSVGTANFDGGETTVYSAPETLNEEAEIKPPYHSSPHYDAKTWRFVLKHAKPGACVWNVA